MMKNKIKSIPSLLVVVFLAVIFFFGTASFNFLTQTENFVKWTSPDEAANYFFAKRFSVGENLAFFDQAAVIGDNMVMPRSFRTDSGWLKPVSFLGIILIYGSLGSILGFGIIPFLTPIFAALGIIIFYFLIKKLFSERVALISAFLLASFPVYIYYTVRSMFHNVLFIVLLLAGIYLLIMAGSVLKIKKNKKKELKGEVLKDNIEIVKDGSEKFEIELSPAGLIVKNETEKEKKEESKNNKVIDFFQNHSFFSFKISTTHWLGFLYAFLGGAFLGLMTITRTSELIWFLPAAFIVWLFYARQFGLVKLILVVCGFVFALLPTAYFNQLLYSAPIYGGYNEMNRSLDDLTEASSGIFKKIITGEGDYLTYFKSIYHNIFYFGFKLEQSIEMAWRYIVEMFPLIFIGFISGSLILSILNIKRPKKKYLVYLLVFVVTSVILIFYYGSWKFNDNPNPNSFTIGNSYTRYWLPIYLMMIPLVSLTIIYLSRFFSLSIKEPQERFKKIIMNGWQAILTLLVCLVGLNFVLYGSEEGLAHLYHNNLIEKKYTEEVFALTEQESIIITRYYDKFLFPDRRVIMGNLPNEEILKAASKLVVYYPIYYYNFQLRDEDIKYLNERKLPDYGLEIKFIKRISHSFGLYSLTAISPLLE